MFIVKDADREIAKVLDFGVAKVTQKVEIQGKAHKTHTGMVLGTPYYMSPEQADGTIALDHRSDQWSLAVMAYECLSGELPFQSEALGNLLGKIMYEEPPSLCDAQPPSCRGRSTPGGGRLPAARLRIVFPARRC